eukprot:scaffold13_cov377-Prasinococcus_capsulatus_cf.AAC.9
MAALPELLVSKGICKSFRYACAATQKGQIDGRPQSGPYWCSTVVVFDDAMEGSAARAAAVRRTLDCKDGRSNGRLRRLAPRTPT